MANVIQAHIDRLVGARADTVFLFDFDGTMVDLVSQPDQVYVPPTLLNALRKLVTRQDTIWAIVSGRQVTQLDFFLPGVEATILGSHGTELRLRHQPTRYLAAPIPEALRRAVRALSKQYECFFEDKIYSLSCHLPESRTDIDLTAALKAVLADKAADYQIRNVGRTYEILQVDFSKGSSLPHLLGTDVFTGRKPVYIGDDVETDDSLQIIKRLGGTLVAVDPYYNPSYLDRPEAWTTDDVRRLVAHLAHS